MPEIGTSGSMSGDEKRSVGHRPQATALILDSTRSKGEELSASKCGPVSTRKQTSANRPVMSQMCQQRTCTDLLPSAGGACVAKSAFLIGP